MIIAVIGHGHSLGRKHRILVHLSVVHGLLPVNWGKGRRLHVLGSNCMNGLLILLVKLCPEVLIRGSLENGFAVLGGIQTCFTRLVCDYRPFAYLELWSKLPYLGIFGVLIGVIRSEQLRSRCYPLNGFFRFG